MSNKEIVSVEKLTALASLIIHGHPDASLVIAKVAKAIQDDLLQNRQNQHLISQYFIRLDRLSLLKVGQQFLQANSSAQSNILLNGSNSENPGDIHAYSLLRQWVLIEYYRTKQGMQSLGYHPPIDGGYPDYGAPLTMPCDEH